MQRDIVTVERFYTQQAGALQLKLVAGANGLKRIIREPTVNRPGLALAGFTKYFASKRVQIIGAAESTFLKSLDKEERSFLPQNPVCRFRAEHPARPGVS
jgi:HPr kinase/phosphorylase